MRTTPISAVAIVLALLLVPASASADVNAVCDAIRAAATQPNDGPLGRPLPLASSWCIGVHQNSTGYAPAGQIKLIEQGHHILPAFHLHDADDLGMGPVAGPRFTNYYEQPLKRAAQLRLPFTFVCTQWEYLLSRDPYLSLPADQNPNVVTVAGKVLPQVCPFGPVDPWRAVGRKWASSAGIAKLQQWYPDPPRVIFLSNNEHPRLTWIRAEESKRYLDKYGKGRDAEFKRKVIGDGWIERYRALLSAMRDGLTAPAWKTNAIFVGYEAFGPPHFARWGGWTEYSLSSPGRIDPGPLAWDGGSPSYYTHDWNPISDYQVYSPQVESQNWLFMQEQARKLNPNFWFELSIWDGSGGDPPTGGKVPKSTSYAKAGQTYDPQRYAGFVQFGMWLTRPRAAREFRGWMNPWEQGGPYFIALCEAVDRVHTNATLREFWKFGTLVPNRAGKHPYQEDIPAEYKDVDRWFLLDTDLTPPRPWKLDTPMPVFALALERGRQPARQWLLYAHAPLGARKGVKVSLPGFKEVAVDVSVAGAFYLVDEKTGQAAPIQ